MRVKAKTLLEVSCRDALLPCFMKKIKLLSPTSEASDHDNTALPGARPDKTGPRLICSTLGPTVGQVTGKPAARLGVKWETAAVENPAQKRPWTTEDQEKSWAMPGFWWNGEGITTLFRVADTLCWRQSSWAHVAGGGVENQLILESCSVSTASHHYTCPSETPPFPKEGAHIPAWHSRPSTRDLHITSQAPIPLLASPDPICMPMLPPSQEVLASLRPPFLSLREVASCPLSKPYLLQNPTYISLTF